VTSRIISAPTVALVDGSNVQDVERICRDGSGIVPDITGLPIYEAAEALKDAGILPTRPLRGDPSQVVTSQDLPPGTERGCGDLSFTTN